MKNPINGIKTGYQQKQKKNELCHILSITLITWKINDIYMYTYIVNKRIPSKEKRIYFTKDKKKTK